MDFFIAIVEANPKVTKVVRYFDDCCDVHVQHTPDDNVFYIEEIEGALFWIDFTHRTALPDGAATFIERYLTPIPTDAECRARAEEPNPDFDEDGMAY